MSTPPAEPHFMTGESVDIPPVDVNLEIHVIRTQLDAIQQQLTWLVNTVHGLLATAQSNPMMRMMMNRATK